MEENKKKTKYFDANLIDGKRLSYKLQSNYNITISSGDLH